MTAEEFENVFNSRVEKCRNTLITKAKEYARDDNRLYNFYRAAGLTRVTPEDSVIGMQIKHMISTLDLWDDFISTLHGFEGKMPPKELIDEKIGDLLNYFILLEAVIEEERKKGR